MNKKKLLENFKSILYAGIIALVIRSFLFQPFYIPSSSMEPNLLVGDRLFVSKYSYGYSRHSLPFSPKISNKRYFNTNPLRGDVVVFKTPADNRTDYIKRLIGLPGDTIQIIDGDLFLNNEIIIRKKIFPKEIIYCGDREIKPNEYDAYEETLPNGNKYIAVYNTVSTMVNTDKYTVPPKHYFFMGDNRDCSKDSRFLSSVGYVSSENLVGKARIIFFSNDKSKGNIFKFWKWNKSIRTERFLKNINEY
ncbi:signal peptidase I [Pelagibacteraceae bacterium]|nr:signal peptidase I [Pelagibacteraceae bacterium]